MMTKKLLEDLLIEFDEMGYEPTTLCDNPQKEVESFRNRLKQVLDYLKSIDNANPSEALEDLKELDIQVRFMGILDVPSWEKYLPIIKQALLKSQEQEKVLEILFKKQVDLGWLWYCIHECINSLNEYNKKMPIEKFKLTQEEFELLKRYFQ